MITLDNDKYIALKIAIFNAIGFSTAVLVTSYIDPQLTSHVKYGARSYPYGYWSLLLSIPILILTFFYMGKCKSLVLKYFFACGPLLVAGCIAVFFVFKPEFPHGNITVWTLSYCGISIITIWIRYAGHHINFLGDENIEVTARIEAIKTQMTIWQTLSVGLTVAYIAILGVWIDKLWANSIHIVSDEKDIFLINMGALPEIILFTFYVAIGPIKESFFKTLSLSTRFSEIRKNLG